MQKKGRTVQDKGSEKHGDAVGMQTNGTGLQQKKKCAIIKNSQAPLGQIPTINSAAHDALLTMPTLLKHRNGLQATLTPCQRELHEATDTKSTANYIRAAHIGHLRVTTAEIKGCGDLY